jgi:hypothetical protein
MPISAVQVPHGSRTATKRYNRRINNVAQSKRALDKNVRGCKPARTIKKRRKP